MLGNLLQLLNLYHFFNLRALVLSEVMQHRVNSDFTVLA